MPRPERLLILFFGWMLPTLLSSSALAKTQTRSFQPGEVSGRKIVDFLALTCSKENWAATANWLKNRHMISKTNTQTMTLKISDRGAEIEHPQILLRTLGDSLIEAKFHVGSHEKVIAGHDTCELMNKARSYKAMAGLSVLLLPEANAENLVEEDRGQDEVFLGVGLASLGAGILFPPAGIISAAFFLWNAYDLIDSSLSLATKRSYEDILNADSILECSESQLTLSGASGRIVITKTKGVAKIDLFGKGSSTAFQGSSDYAPKSSAYLIKLANDCHDSNDATRLMALMKAERSGASTQVAAVSSPANSPVDTTAPVAKVVN